MVFKALPVGVSRNVDGSVLPLVSGDGTVVGFSSSQGDTFMPSVVIDPLTGGISLPGTLARELPTFGASPAATSIMQDAKGRKTVLNGSYDIFRSANGWQRMCDGATDTQKVSLLDVFIPAGTLHDGATLVISHYWQFPTGDKTTTGIGTKNIFLSLDDSVSSSSSFYASSANAGKGFDAETEMRMIGDTLFVPNQLKASGQSTNGPVTLSVKDFQRDHYLKFFSYWTSNQTSGTDSICLASVKVRVHA